MKRKLPLLLSVCGALGLAAGDAAAQAKYNLRWGHYLADSPFVQLEKDFANEIEKRTNGQVKITITFAQGLGKTTELLTLTAKGAIDMTATAPGYNPDQLHYWRAFQLPLTFETSKQAMHVLGVVVKEFPVYRQEMNKAGVYTEQAPVAKHHPAMRCVGNDAQLAHHDGAGLLLDAGRDQIGRASCRERV